MKTVKLFAVLSVVSGLLVAPAAYASKADDLVKDLAVVEKSAAALDALVKMKQDAVPALIGEAVEGKDISARGWAIVALSKIGGKDAESTLKKLSEGSTQPQLVRTWAAAGRIEMAPDFDSVLDLAPLAAQYPATRRTLTMRITALASGAKGGSAERMLKATATDYNLQQALLEPILALGSEKLLDTMLHGKEIVTRQQAAAYLATLAVRQGKAGNEIVGTAVAKAYAFDPKAKDVPWAGGPLYVPNINWEKSYGEKLCNGLVAWLLWADRNGKTETEQQIVNNLNSYTLANTVGYQMNWNNRGAVDWLRTWKAVVGKEGIRKILEEQGVADVPRYASVLEGK